MSYADPGWKILTLAWWGFFVKITRKIDNLIFWIKIKWFKELEYHFIKHGNDFSVNTKDDYFNMARQFAEDKDKNILHKINKYNDSIIKYNPNTNIFMSININTKEIRTFYKPNVNIHGYKTNLDYFNAQ